MFKLAKIICFISLLLLFACGDGINGGENYGDLLSSPEGLILVESEHVGGWGRADCFFCHPIANMHLANQTSVPGIDMEEVRQITLSQGEAGCADCHGSNGLF